MKKNKYKNVIAIIIIGIIVLAYNLSFYENRNGIIEKDTILLKEPYSENIEGNKILRKLKKGTKIKVIRRIEEKETWYYEIEEEDTKMKGYVYYVDVINN